MNDQKRLIAVVDDDSLTLKVLCSGLQKFGFETASYQSGEEFIESAKERLPDLVLLDLMMPQMNGHQVLETLRGKYSPFELPIIMLTSKDDPKDIVLSFKAGASDFITKPAHPEVAIARIRTQLQLKSYYLDRLKRRELETLNAMIATYNHEINNPLVIALGNLRPEIEQMTNERLTTAIAAVNRISNIVRSIRDLMNTEPSYSDYSKNQKIINLKKSS